MSDFDGVVLPGGEANPDALRMNADAVAFVRGFFEADKPVAAICHAPWILAELRAREDLRLICPAGTPAPALRWSGRSLGPLG